MMRQGVLRLMAALVAKRTWLPLLVLAGSSPTVLGAAGTSRTTLKKLEWRALRILSHTDGSQNVSIENGDGHEGSQASSAGGDKSDTEPDFIFSDHAGEWFIMSILLIFAVLIFFCISNAYRQRRARRARYVPPEEEYIRRPSNEYGLDTLQIRNIRASLPIPMTEMVACSGSWAGIVTHKEEEIPVENLVLHFLAPADPMEEVHVTDDGDNSTNEAARHEDAIMANDNRALSSSTSESTQQTPDQHVHSTSSTLREPHEYIGDITGSGRNDNGHFLICGRFSGWTGKVSFWQRMGEGNEANILSRNWQADFRGHLIIDPTTREVQKLEGEHYIRTGDEFSKGKFTLKPMEIGVENGQMRESHVDSIFGKPPTPLRQNSNLKPIRKRGSSNMLDGLTGHD